MVAFPNAPSFQVLAMPSPRFLALGALLLLPSLAPGQSFEQRRRRDLRPDSYRMAVGMSLDYGQPIGEFEDYVKQGFGIDGFFRWNGDRRGILSLRVEGGYLGYGRETFSVPLSPTIGGRIRVDVTTSNNIVWFGAGPQITLPVPGFRPYVNGTAGISYFFTESSVEGADDDLDFASTRNYDDGTFSWGVGSGLLIPFRTRTGEVSIDLGVRYHGNGEVRYLRKGGIEDLPDGSIRLHPIQSEANLLTYRVGISVAIR
jgi:hypothetical protein